MANLRQVSHISLVLALLAGTLSALTAGAAHACACGGAIAADALDSTSELALLTHDGTTESLTMTLSFDGDATDAALVVPTPAPATVSAADPTLWSNLAALTRPRIRHETHWFDWTRDPADSAGAPATTAPTVVSQVHLGPLEATTLRGGDLGGVRTWLRAHHYDLPPNIAQGLDVYLRDGWSITAMKLTAPSLRGSLDPVTLRFPSDHLVYPIRMSKYPKNPTNSATAGEPVTVFVRSDHRIARTDPDAAAQGTTTSYAGPVTTSNTTIGSGYLTKLQMYPSPATITADMTFAAAPSDDPVGTEEIAIDRLHLGRLPAGWFLIGVGVIVLVIGAVAALRHRQRRPSASGR